MNAGGRVEQERKALGISQPELARRVNRLGCKTTQGAIDKLEKRDSANPRCLPELARILNVSEKWLRTGRGSKQRDEPPATAPMGEVSIVSWVSAGEMAREDLSDVEIGKFTICGLPKGDWIALRVQGDSMDRISPPNSIILVNRRETRLIPNGLYVIADTDGNTTYKRYRPGPPPRFEPVSTNPQFDAIFPTNDPVIIGRVRRSILET